MFGGVLFRAAAAAIVGRLFRRAFAFFGLVSMTVTVSMTVSMTVTMTMTMTVAVIFSAAALFEFTFAFAFCALAHIFSPCDFIGF